jgi:hypothetical protein
VCPSDVERSVVTVLPVPSAAAYREAAARFTWLAENLRREAALLSGLSLTDLLGSGSVADAVAERLARAAGDLGSAADEVARLSRVCGQRAEVCDLYRMADRAWWARSDVERGRFPAQPYPWVPTGVE